MQLLNDRGQLDMQSVGWNSWILCILATYYLWHVLFLQNLQCFLWIPRLVFIKVNFVKVNLKASKSNTGCKSYKVHLAWTTLYLLIHSCFDSFYDEIGIPVED